MHTEENLESVIITSSWDVTRWKPLNTEWELQPNSAKHALKVSLQELAPMAESQSVSISIDTSGGGPKSRRAPSLSFISVASASKNEIFDEPGQGY